MAKKKLTDRIVTDYEPGDVYLSANAYYNWRRRPPFHRMFHVPAMLVDARVQMALGILKGMITSLARFYVEEGMSEIDDTPSDVKQFLVKQIERFWRVGANRLMSAMEWGFYGAEVLYDIDSDGHFCFKGFQDFRPSDIAPVTMDGEFIGIEIRHKSHPTYIGGQKAFWHVHWRHHNKWLGGSRLRGAFMPWLDKVDEGGALDVRRLYYYKHVFQGEIIRHPPGSHVDENGNSKPYSEIARSMVEKARAGGVYALPAIYDEAHGNPLWDIVDRHANSAAQDVREYCSDLDKEISEGIGLSEEVYQAAETGSGYSGRKIPEQAARGMLTEVVYWMIADADAQIFRPLVKRNFGIVPDYEIIPFGIIDSGEDDDVRGTSTPEYGKKIDQIAQKAHKEMRLAL